MARLINRLSATGIKAKLRPGYHPDGAGLYLQVTAGGSRSWIFRFMLNGKAREMGLGSLLAVSLESARIKAAEQRALLAEGKDPIAERDREQREQALRAARTLTFDQCAEQYIEAHRGSWRNAKHASQWKNTLDTYASPKIGALSVADIDMERVLSVIEPLWRTTTETASRLRGRIENILDWATVKKYREGDNPARWRGHLDKVLPKRSKVAAVKHHAALPYSQMNAFMVELQQREGIAPKALQFVILTAARVSEAVNAKWSELDLEAKVWTVPPARMKAGKEHRVPITPEVEAILDAVKLKAQSDYVFPGQRVGKPLTGAACLGLLADMGRSDLTTHGFRSTFRDWCAEQTNFPREIAEAALAHTLRDKTEAAYQRGDLLERRRQLMAAWASYCAKKPAEVIAITDASKEKKTA